MGGTEVTSVELVDRWVFGDLSSGRFTDEDKREILNDLDELEEQLATWGRPLHRCVDILADVCSETVYRRRQGDFRMYLLRDGETLYCIGVGIRDTTYDRDLSGIGSRAEAFGPTSE